jgi:hypothetical protein
MIASSSDELLVWSDGDAVAAIQADVTISGRRRQLIDIYESFRKDSRPGIWQEQSSRPVDHDLLCCCG